MKAHHILLLFMFSALIGCKKEDLDDLIQPKNFIWQEAGCDDVLIETPTFYEGYEHGIQYKQPTFNPNNPNEFVYFEYDAADAHLFHQINELNRKLVKYNIATGTKQTLLSDINMYGQIAWNSNGWIAFSSDFGLIHLIKDNGSQLTQFTSIPGGYESSNKHLTWLNNENQLVWAKNDVNGTKIMTKTIGDVGENEIIGGSEDSERTFFSKDGKIIINADNSYSGNLIFKTSHIQNEEIEYTELNSNISGSPIRGLGWSADGNYFYTLIASSLENFDVYKVDIQTGNAEVVISFCEKYQLKNISMSSNGQYLLYEKMELVDEESEQGYVEMETFGISQSTIWLYDINTGKEALID